VNRMQHVSSELSHHTGASFDANRWRVNLREIGLGVAAVAAAVWLVTAIDMSWPPRQCDAHAVMLKDTVADCSTN
jgi:hypothetical protein